MQRSDSYFSQDPILIPRDNEKNLKEIPHKILKALQIILVSHMDEVLKEALVTPISVEEKPSPPPQAVSQRPGQRLPAVMM